MSLVVGGAGSDTWIILCALCVSLPPLRFKAPFKRRARRDTQSQKNLCNSLPIFPTLPDDAREEPEPQFVLKAGNRVTARECRPDRKKLPDTGAIKIARHACDVWNSGKIKRRAFRRFHIKTVVVIKNRATDTVPVKPLA